MKIEELNKIRDSYKDTVGQRPAGADSTRIVVGMATCGVAAGAQPVYDYLKNEAEKSDGKIQVIATGCIGICQFEPVFEVMAPGKEKVTYVKMTVEKAQKVMEQHIKGGKVVEEYTIGA